MRGRPDNPPAGRANWPGRGASFTLLELLVVIAILALLLAILLPSLSRARVLGRRTVCLANLSMIGKAAALYQADHADYIPISWRNVPPEEAHAWVSWRAALLPYADAFGVFNCPGADDRGVKGELFHSAEEITGLQMDGTVNAGSYGVIYQYSLPGYKTLTYSGTQARGHPMWSSAFSTMPGVSWRHPSESAYAADAVFTGGPITYPSRAGYKGYGTSVVVPPSEPAYCGEQPGRRFADRHLGTACLFVDGRAAAYDTASLDAMAAGEGDCIWDTE